MHGQHVEFPGNFAFGRKSLQFCGGGGKFIIQMNISVVFLQEFLKTCKKMTFLMEFVTILHFFQPCWPAVIVTLCIYLRAKQFIIPHLLVQACTTCIYYAWLELRGIQRESVDFFPLTSCVAHFILRESTWIPAQLCWRESLREWIVGFSSNFCPCHAH